MYWQVRACASRSESVAISPSLWARRSRRPANQSAGTVPASETRNPNTSPTTAAWWPSDSLG